MSKWLFIIVVGLAILSRAMATDKPISKDGTGRVVEEGEVIQERVLYEVVGARFTPALEIDASFDASDGTKSELVAARVIQAMMRSDFDEWLLTWDDGGRDFYVARELGPVGAFKMRTREETKKYWTEWFKGNSVFVVAKLEKERFSVVTYEIRKPTAIAEIGKPGFSFNFEEDGVLRSRVLLVRQADGTWRQSGEYASHPVSLGWRAGNASGPGRKADESDWGRTSIWPPK